MWTWVYIADTCVKVGTGGSSHGPAVGVKHHARRLEALEGISTSNPAEITSHNWVSKLKDVEISLWVFFWKLKMGFKKRIVFKTSSGWFSSLRCSLWLLTLPDEKDKTYHLWLRWHHLLIASRWVAWVLRWWISCWGRTSSIKTIQWTWICLKDYGKLDSKESYNGSTSSRCHVKISDIYRHNIQCARESVRETKADRQNSKRFAISQAAGSRWPSCHSSLRLREVHDWYDHTNGTGEDTFFFFRVWIAWAHIEMYEMKSFQPIVINRVGNRCRLSLAVSAGQHSSNQGGSPVDSFAQEFE